MTIRNERDYVLVTLYLKSNEVENVTETTRKTTQKTTQKLTEQQEAILDYLSVHPSASRKEVAEHVDNITEDGVKYNLNRLQQMGLLKRIGADRGGHWEIMEN